MEFRPLTPRLASYTYSTSFGGEAQADLGVVPVFGEA